MGSAAPPAGTVTVSGRKQPKATSFHPQVSETVFPQGESPTPLTHPCPPQMCRTYQVLRSDDRAGETHTVGSAGESLTQDPLLEGHLAVATKV